MYQSINQNNKLNLIDLNTFSDNYKWKDGIAIAQHTISSSINQDGSFSNIRTQIGEVLYQFKYKQDISQLNYLATIMCDALNIWWVTKYIDIIIPAPFSNKDRIFQPVYELAQEVSNRIGIPIDLNFIIKIKSVPELKSIDNPEERKKLLQNIFFINNKTIHNNKNILIIDDLFRSGATLNALSELLYREANAKMSMSLL